MRFETSQTTPSYLDRRLQLRMLSFVALISIIMVTLSVMNRRAGTGADAANRQTSLSPDSLTFDVHRDTRVLKPDEVIIARAVEDNGPRGQLADSNSREILQPDLAGEEKDLFKSRSQERVRDNRFFARRSMPSANIDDERPKSVQPTTTDFTFDGDVSNETPLATGPERVSTRAAPPLDDEWNQSTEQVEHGQVEFGQDDPPPREPRLERGRGEVADEFDRDEPPRREPPTFNVRNPKSGPLFEEIQQPIRSGRPENDPIDSPREISTRNDRRTRDEQPFEQWTGNSKTRIEMQGTRPIDGDPFVSPVDPRRQEDRRTHSPEREPFREDFASARIDKRYLDPIKDNTLGIRNDESEVFYWLVDHARRVSSAALDRAGMGEVQYVNLMTEPDRFRGDPITIEGDLWRLYEVDAGPNEYGVKRIYEGWVFTGDSGNHPYRIVCTSLAKGIEPAESLRKPVRITGYFFKREGYRSNGGVHVAPTLIAHRIEINPMPNGIPLTAGVVPYMIGAIMAIALALLVTIVGFAISDERSSGGGLRKLRTNPHVSFSDLECTAPISVEESLRQLAERERESTVSGAYGPLLTRQAAREHAVHDETTPRQSRIDSERRQLQRQSEAVQTWASRQQANQWEIGALRATNSDRSFHNQDVDDELSSDTLEPARHVVTRFESVDQHKPIEDSIPNSPVIQVPAPIVPPPVPAEVHLARPQATSNPQPTANIAYSASKLFEWEEEIAKMNGAKPA